VPTLGSRAIRLPQGAQRSRPCCPPTSALGTHAGRLGRRSPQERPCPWKPAEEPPEREAAPDAARSAAEAHWRRFPRRAPPRLRQCRFASAPPRHFPSTGALPCGLPARVGMQCRECASGLQTSVVSKRIDSQCPTTVPTRPEWMGLAESRGGIASARPILSSIDSADRLTHR
jgi:hypothetical protein